MVGLVINVSAEVIELREREEGHNDLAWLSVVLTGDCGAQQEL